jgi:hypothetical protein
MQGDEPRLLLERILRSRRFREDEELSQSLVSIANQQGGGDAEALGIALRAYFANEGRHERLRAAVPSGQHRLFFYEAETEPGLSPLESFWQPHLGGSKSLLLHGLTEAGTVELDEMYAVLAIATWLQEQGGVLEVRPAPDVLPADVDVILTGAAATNPLVRDDEFRVYRMATAQGRVVTVIRDLDAARMATGEEAMALAASPFPEGFPAEFGLKF